MLDFTVGYSGKTTVDRMYDDNLILSQKIYMIRIVKCLNLLSNVHIKYYKNFGHIMPRW